MYIYAYTYIYNPQQQQLQYPFTNKKHLHSYTADSHLFQTDSGGFIKPSRKMLQQTAPSQMRIPRSFLPAISRGASAQCS